MMMNLKNFETRIVHFYKIVISIDRDSFLLNHSVESAFKIQLNLSATALKKKKNNLVNIKRQAFHIMPSILKILLCWYIYAQSFFL